MYEMPTCPSSLHRRRFQREPGGTRCEVRTSAADVQLSDLLLALLRKQEMPDAFFKVFVYSPAVQEQRRHEVKRRNSVARREPKMPEWKSGAICPEFWEECGSPAVLPKSSEEHVIPTQGVPEYPAVS